jgi:hypothetical protein
MCDKLDNRRTKFILAARERHGDKYDYSQVVFTEESYCKVTIICPVHGPFVQAASNHIQKRKTQAGGYMGCRKCGNDQRPHKSICEDCGCWNKYAGSSKVCKECAKKRKEARRLRTAMKYLCGECGKPTGSRDKIYCSSECRTAKNRVKVHCSYCNTEIVKSACQVRRSEKLFCNPECQRLSMVGVSKCGDPSRISRLAKEAWKRKYSRERRSASVAYKWWRLCCNGVKQPVEVSDWQRRAKSGASCLSSRCPASSRIIAKRPVTSWTQAIKKERSKIGRKRRHDLDCSWNKRCGNAVRSLTRRRKKINGRKAEAKESQQQAAVGAYRVSTVQMCFEWY